MTEAILAGLPTIRVTGISPAAVISKTDNHWNVEGNEYVMNWVGRDLVRELRQLH